MQTTHQWKQLQVAFVIHWNFKTFALMFAFIETHLLGFKEHASL